MYIRMTMCFVELSSAFANNSNWTNSVSQWQLQLPMGSICTAERPAAANVTVAWEASSFTISSPFVACIPDREL